MKRHTCRLCGEPIVYDAERYAWVHKQPGADHGPVPEKEVFNARRRAV